MKTFVMGDIHGGYRALTQVLERSDFIPDEDRLIVLGDVCDGWPEVKQCIDLLMEIPNLVYILGNHDIWTKEWLENNVPDPYIWLEQGGINTVVSFFPEDITPHSHYMEVAIYTRNKTPDPKYLEFFQKGLPYFVDEKDRAYVHGGWDYELSRRIEDSKYTLMDFAWCRQLWYEAVHNHENVESLTAHPEVFIGHTAVHHQGPFKMCEVWNMDTGAGWSGKLSMMNVDTKEVFRSDLVKELYPNIPGRG